MTFHTDERARVPFALVGVLLLVTSGAYVTALGTGADAKTEVQSARAADEATSVARSALARAARMGARDAVRNPTLTAANTSAGRALAAANDSSFRAGLRLRIALAARDALAKQESRAGPVSANVSLAATRTAELLDAVAIQRRADGRMTVRFDGLSLALVRDGRTVSQRRYDASVTVPATALDLHDRVRNFSARLRGDYLDAGLPRRMTGMLHLAAWARGYAQYGGAPIGNVLANRHVALAANSALLRAQRNALGASDPRSRRTLGDAALRTGLSDALGGIAKATEPAPDTEREPKDAVHDAVATIDAGGGPTPVNASVGSSADEGLVSLLDADIPERALDSIFSADARRLVRVETVGTDVTADPRPVNLPPTTVERNRSVRVADAPDDTAIPDAPERFVRVGTARRTVSVTVRTNRTWVLGNDTRSAVSVRETTHRVGVALAARPGRAEPAPWRPLVDPFNDTAYAGVPERVRTALLTDAGGADAVAEAAVTEGESAARANASFAVEPPDGTMASALDNLTSLRERAANVSVDLPPSVLVDANPASSLADRFAAWRAALPPVPAAYPSGAARLRFALRRAYLDRVETLLDRRTRRNEDVGDRLTGVIDKAGLPLGDASISDLLTPAPMPPNGSASDITVRARPAYLSLSAVESDDAGVRYPMAARNTNLFTVPYGDVADTIVGSILGNDKREYELGTAARALAAANETLAAEANETVADQRDALADSLESATGEVRDELEATLLTAGVERNRTNRTVAAGLESWRGRHAEALAMANGSAAEPIAAAAAARAGLDARNRTRLTAALRVVLAEERTVSLSESTLEDAAESTRSLANREIASLTADATERLAGEAVARLPKRLRGAVAAAPAGLPVTPVPGFWYATLNAWDVAARGGYRTLTVSERAGNPALGNYTYVREDAPIELDVDGDGSAERVGHNEAVSFDVRTGVVVVVPPGGSGVGDGANADERSPGWG